MSPLDIKLILDALNRRFDESDAHFDRLFARLQQPARGRAPSSCDDDSGADPVDALVAPIDPGTSLDGIQKVGIALPCGSKTPSLGSVRDSDLTCLEQLAVDAAASACTTIDAADVADISLELAVPPHLTMELVQRSPGDCCFADVLIGTLSKVEKILGGTCTIALPDPPDVVVYRAKHLLHGNHFTGQLDRGEGLDEKLLGLARCCNTSGKVFSLATIQHCGPIIAGDVLLPEQKLAIYTTSVLSVSSLSFYGAFNICEGHKIFVEMIGPNSVLLELLLVVKITQWSPSGLDCNTKFVNSNQLYFSFWSLFCLGWVAVQYRPPWPPPHQFEMLSEGVQFRPIPWPSFNCLTTWCSTCSVHERLMQLLYGAISQGLMEFDSVSHWFVISFVGLIAEMRFFSSMALLQTILPVQKHHQLLSPDALIIIIPLVDLMACYNKWGDHKLDQMLKSKENVLPVMLKDNQHQPWPPPTELRLTIYAVELESVPGPLFDMLEGSSVICQPGQIWKPPWHVPIQQETSKLQPSDIVEFFGPETSVWCMELTWLICTFTQESRQCIGQGLYSEHKFWQFAWDPGGSILHRLGGKPNLKERGMLGSTMAGLTWACYGWADA